MTFDESEFCRNFTAGLEVVAPFTETDVWILKTRTSATKIGMSGAMLPPMLLLTSSVLIFPSSIPKFRLFTNLESLIEYVNLDMKGCLNNNWLVLNRILIVAYYLTLLCKLGTAAIMQFTVLEQRLSCKYHQWVVYVINCALGTLWILINFLELDKDVRKELNLWGTLVPNSMAILSIMLTIYAIYILRNEVNQDAARRYLQYAYFKFMQELCYIGMSIFLVVIVKLQAEKENYTLFSVYNVFSCVFALSPVFDLLALYNVLHVEEPVSLVTPFFKAFNRILRNSAVHATQ